MYYNLNAYLVVYKIIIAKTKFFFPYHFVILIYEV